MKASLISFLAGLLMGVLYTLMRVKSPAPPIVALLGLLGMVLGEQAGGWLLARNTQAIRPASAHLVGSESCADQKYGMLLSSLAARMVSRISLRTCPYNM
jgi:XapX domain-containing protein